MATFNSALELVIERRFGSKQTALAAACGMQQSDISKLLRDEAPLTATKLDKILHAEGLTAADQQLLSQSAVRDFVGEDAYHTHFVHPTTTESLREDLGGPEYRGLFPISPRAEQSLRYLIAHAHEPDVTQALELIAKFLALPEPTSGSIDRAQDAFQQTLPDLHQPTPKAPPQTANGASQPAKKQA